MLLTKFKKQSSLTYLAEHDDHNLSISAFSGTRMYIQCNDCDERLVQVTLDQTPATSGATGTMCERCHVQLPLENHKWCVDCIEAMSE